MPKWIKTVIEIVIVWLKRTGRIDPNVNKKSEPYVDPTTATKDVRGNSVHSRR